MKSILHTLVTIFILLFALATMHPLCALGENIEIRPLSSEDHFQHPMREKSYMESWNYHLLTESGRTLIVSFLVSNIGIVGGTAGVQLTWADPDSSPVIRNDRCRAADLKEQRTKGIIRIGKHTAELAGDTTRVCFDSKNLTANLTIRSCVPGFKIVDGKTFIKDKTGKYYRFFVEIPRGTFNGTITVAGKTQAISGSAYMDHSVSNIVSSSFSSHWTSIRAFFPEYTVSLMEFSFLPELGGGRWAFGYVANDKQLLGVSKDFVLESISFCAGEKKTRVPSGFHIQMTLGGHRLDGTCKNIALYCSTPILGDLNWFARKLASVFAGNPMVYRFLSNAEFSLKTNSETRELKGFASQTYIQMKN